MVSKSRLIYFAQLIVEILGNYVIDQKNPTVMSIFYQFLQWSHHLLSTSIMLDYVFQSVKDSFKKWWITK